jgi:hypothetical protein
MDEAGDAEALRPAICRIQRGSGDGVAASDDEALCEELHRRIPEMVRSESLSGTAAA